MSTFWQRYKRNKSAVFGLGVILLVIIMAATANFLYPFDPFRLAGKPLSGPGMNGFLLGSDSLGRDVAAGIVHGAKTSLLIGLIATLVAVFIGIVFGAFSGYYGDSAIYGAKYLIEKNFVDFIGTDIHKESQFEGLKKALKSEQLHQLVNSGVLLNHTLKD